jgi:hypothetical protein
MFKDQRPFNNGFVRAWGQTESPSWCVYKPLCDTGNAFFGAKAIRDKRVALRYTLGLAMQSEWIETELTYV